MNRLIPLIDAIRAFQNASAEDRRALAERVRDLASGLSGITWPDDVKKGVKDALDWLRRNPVRIRKPTVR